MIGVGSSELQPAAHAILFHPPNPRIPALRWRKAMDLEMWPIARKGGFFGPKVPALKDGSLAPGVGRDGTWG